MAGREEGFRLSPDELDRLVTMLIERQDMTRTEMTRLQSHVAARWTRFVRGCCRRHDLLGQEVDDATELTLVAVLWNIERRNETTLRALAASGVEGLDFKRHIAGIARFKVIDVIHARPEDPAEPVAEEDRSRRALAIRNAGTLAPHDEPDLFEEVIGEALTARVITQAEAALLRDRMAGMELHDLALAHGLADATTIVGTARARASRTVSAIVRKLVAFLGQQGR